MTDLFQNAVDSLNAPTRNVFAIVPHDTAPLGSLPKAIYVGTGGTLVLRTIDAGADVTLKNVGASHVRATGTTVADLVGLA